jgi:serine/threonine-protein kinase
VLKQDPESDTLMRAGDTVTLTVATAKTTALVPDLTGMTTSDASLTLSDLGLTLGSQTPAPSDTYDPGQIISQAIAPETPVPVGTPIDVTVASGPASVTLTDLTCQPYGAAKAELKQLGLVDAFGGTRPVLPQCSNKNFVAFQEPPAGTQVPRGSTVTLYTGEDASPTASPSPTP